MKRISALLIAVLAGATASPLACQLRGGEVLSPGDFRVSVGATHDYADEIFADGGTAALGGEFNGPLTAATFAPLGGVESRVSAFLAETEAVGAPAPSDASALSAGNLEVEAASNLRYLPIGLSLGLLPRVEIGVEVPVYRRERILRRFGLEGGNLGVNPDVEGNAAILSAISESAAALGSAPVLPLSTSALGGEIQRRVMDLTGQSLALPDTALTGTTLRSSFPSAPMSRRVDSWQVGDVELHARIAVLRSFGDQAYPSSGDGGFEYRLTGIAAVRFPTGQRPPIDWVFDAGSVAGFGGASVGAIGDIFWGERIWLSGGGAFRRLREAEVEAFRTPEDGPLAAGAGPITVLRSPGDRAELWIAPRVRLTREFSIGAIARTDWLGDGSDVSDAGTIVRSGGSRHDLGFSIRYSTLPDLTDNGGPPPIEAVVGFTSAVGGSDGRIAADVAFFQVSIRNSLW